MRWHVWSEGTGERSGATFMGTSKGKTFKDACAALLLDDIYYKPEDNTYWGCHLYPTEAGARKSFG